MSNPSYTYYGTPRTTPDDAPFLRPSPALASSLSVEHRDSASTTPTPYDSFPPGTPTNSAPLLVTEIAYPPYRAQLTALYNSLWYSGNIV